MLITLQHLTRTKLTNCKKKEHESEKLSSEKEGMSNVLWVVIVIFFVRINSKKI